METAESQTAANQARPQLNGALSHRPDCVVAGNTEQTLPENRKIYAALDGFRGLAFLLVFFSHYEFVPWAWTGVNFFFVLSGFLITGILYDTRNDVHRMRNFYVRRALRIFPLFYACLLLVVLLWPTMHWQWNWLWLIWTVYLGNFLRFLHPYAAGSSFARLADFQPTGSNGNFFTSLYLGHFWSLCVEEQFYLVWPWVVFWIRNRRNLIILCATGIVLTLAARFVGQLYLPVWMQENGVFQRATPFCMDSLLFGGLLALLLRGSKADAILRAGRIAFGFALAILILLAATTSFGRFTAQPYVYPHGTWTWCISLIDLLAVLLLISALHPRSVTYRILNIRPLRWLGFLSYGAYVFHDIPNQIYHFIGRSLAPACPRLVTDTVAFLCTLGFAALSFRFVEKPFLNLKERWTIRYSPKPLDTPSESVTGSA